MIKTHYLELPLSRTCFHGSKGVRAIEVRLYNIIIIVIISGDTCQMLRRSQSDVYEANVSTIYGRTYLTLPTKQQTTKFSSANFPKMLSQSYIILRRLDGKQCRSR